MWIFLDLVSLILEFLEFSGFWGRCQENLGILVSCPFWGAEDLENLDVVRPKLEHLECLEYISYIQIVEFTECNLLPCE